MGKRVYLHPSRQIAALILIDRVFLLTQGRQRESIKKGFLSALGNGLTVKLYTSALLSSKSHLRLCQPLCCCSLMPVGEIEAQSHGDGGPK